MPIVYYPARIAPDEGGGFVFQAIDLPEAISQGETVAEALAHGTEALQLVVDTWNEGVAPAKRRALPDPTPLDRAAAVDADGKPCHVQLVPAALSEPTVKINVTMPGDLIKRIDAVAGNYGRSGFIAEACREKLAAKPLPVFDLIDNRLVPRADSHPPRVIAVHPGGMVISDRPLTADNVGPRRKRGLAAASDYIADMPARRATDEVEVRAISPLTGKLVPGGKGKVPRSALSKAR